MTCMRFWILLFMFCSAYAREPLPASRFEHLTGLKGQQDSKLQWDQRYARQSFVFGKTPAKFLSDNYYFLPFEGSVLDLGMGEGRNAVFLAQKGFKVTGIDISSVAVKKAQLLAQEYGVKIKGVTADLKSYTIAPSSFDAIVCFYYVDRGLIEKMKSWLKPGGVLIYEAHTLAQKRFTSHRNDPDEYFLKDQELLKMFSGMRILKFEEPLHEKEFRSSIVLQKPE